MGNSLFKMRLQNTNCFVHSFSFSCFPPPSPNQARQIVLLLQGSPIQTVKLNCWLLLRFIVVNLKFWETKHPSIRASSKQNVFHTFYKKGHLLEWHGLASSERIEPVLCHLEEPSFWFSFLWVVVFGWLAGCFLTLLFGSFPSFPLRWSRSMTCACYCQSASTTWVVFLRAREGSVLSQGGVEGGVRAVCSSYWCAVCDSQAFTFSSPLCKDSC